MNIVATRPINNIFAQKKLRSWQEETKEHEKMRQKWPKNHTINEKASGQKMPGSDSYHSIYFQEYDPSNVYLQILCQLEQKWYCGITHEHTQMKQE